MVTVAVTQACLGFRAEVIFMFGVRCMLRARHFNLVPRALLLVLYGSFHFVGRLRHMSMKAWIMLARLSVGRSLRWRRPAPKVTLFTMQITLNIILRWYLSYFIIYKHIRNHLNIFSFSTVWLSALYSASSGWPGSAIRARSTARRGSADYLRR